jgi:hypothetical protein
LLLYVFGTAVQIAMMVAGNWYLKVWGFESDLFVTAVAPLPISALFFVFGWVLRERPSGQGTERVN